MFFSNSSDERIELNSSGYSDQSESSSFEENLKKPLLHSKYYHSYRHGLDEIFRYSAKYYRKLKRSGDNYSDSYKFFLGINIDSCPSCNHKKTERHRIRQVKFSVSNSIFNKDSDNYIVNRRRKGTIRLFKRCYETALFTKLLSNKYREKRGFWGRTKEDKLIGKCNKIFRSSFQ